MRPGWLRLLGAAVLALLAYAGWREWQRRAERGHIVSPVRSSRPDAVDNNTPDGGPAKPKEAAGAARPQEDLAWLAGTWERQGGSEWLLFNPPDVVVKLSGKPATVTARGRFIASGRFLTVTFPAQVGTVDRELQGSKDLSELTDPGPPPAHYRRGAPPP